MIYFQQLADSLFEGARRCLYRLEGIWWHWFRVFPYRVWLYRHWLAYDQDFDWDSLARIMQIKLDRMAKVFDNGHTVGHKQDAKECRIAAHLLRRLHEDNYTLQQMQNRVPDADCKLMGKLLGRKLRCWWD